MNRDDALDHLRNFTLDRLYALRADAINQARDAGCTWRSIALTLGMTEAGVQRAPGVKSPHNARQNTPEAQ